MASIHFISARAQSTPTSGRPFNINDLQPYFAFMAVVISLIIFIVLSAAAWYLVRGIVRRRSSTGPPRTLVLPTMLAREAPPTLLATCSALVAQSTLLVTSPIRIGIMPEDLGGKNFLRRSMDFACQGMKRSVSWGKTSIGLFGTSLPSSTFNDGLSLSADSILAKLLALQGHYDADTDNLEGGRKHQAFYFGEPLPEVVPTDAAGLFQYTLCLTDAFEDASDPVPFVSAATSQNAADLRTGSIASDIKSVAVEKSSESAEKSAAQVVVSAKVVSSEVITSEVVSSTSTATVVLDSSVADVPLIKFTYPSCDHVVSESIQASILAPADINVLSTEWQPKPSIHKRTRSELTVRKGMCTSSRRERRRSMAVFDENMVTTTTTTTTIRGGRRSRSASMTVTRSMLMRLSSVAEDSIAEWPPVAF